MIITIITDRNRRRKIFVAGVQGRAHLAVFGWRRARKGIIKRASLLFFSSNMQSLFFSHSLLYSIDGQLSCS